MSTEIITPSVNDTYARTSDLITKALIVLATKKGYSVSARGSLDVDLAMNRSSGLPASHYRINRAKMMANEMELAGPSLYPSVPMDHGVRIQADDESFIPEAVSVLTDTIKIPSSVQFPHSLDGVKSWKRNLPGFEEAWHSVKPGDELSLTHEKLSFAPHLPILWYTWFARLLSDTGKAKFQAQSYRVKDTTVTMEAIQGLLDRRHPDKCFTFDGLRAGLSLDPQVVSEISFDTPQKARHALEVLSNMPIRVDLPTRPKNSTLTPKAIQYYTGGIYQGDMEAHDSIVEALIRESTRKLSIYGAKFNRNILPIIRSFMFVVGPWWRARSHDAPLMQAYTYDIKAALELAPIATLWNIHKTHGYKIMKPEVQEVMGSRKAVWEVEKRVRKGMNTHGFDHNASIMPLKSGLVDWSLGQLIWPLSSRRTSNVLSPSDATNYPPINEE